MRPKKVHFITGLRRDFGGKPFILVHLLGILSAKLAYPDHEIFLYYEFEPFGPCWEIAKRYVTAVVVKAPTEVFGRPVRHFAHAADVLRLKILIEQGGIYFDMDTLVLRPIDGMPVDRVVMGVESADDTVNAGLCNAFIAAPQQAEFLRLWFDRYRDFDDAHWQSHSVGLPLDLSTQFPELIHIESRYAFFYPSHDAQSIRDIFERTVNVERSYSIHLWETLSWEYIRDITPRSILTNNSTYNIRARRVLTAFHEEVTKMGTYGDLANELVRRTFDDIYQRNQWGSGSGTGSQYANNIEYCAFVSRFMERNNVRSVVDLGCGDWQFSRFINWNRISYMGIDAVPAVVVNNNSEFASEFVNFSLFENFDTLPKADLLLCKDTMQHWSNELINQALIAWEGKFRYILLTNDEEPLDIQNKEIEVGGWRPIDIRNAPFERRAATLLSWYVYDGTLVRKSTMLMLDM